MFNTMPVFSPERLQREKQLLRTHDAGCLWSLRNITAMVGTLIRSRCMVSWPVYCRTSSWIEDNYGPPAAVLRHGQFCSFTTACLFRKKPMVLRLRLSIHCICQGKWMGLHSCSVTWLGTSHLSQIAMLSRVRYEIYILHPLLSYARLSPSSDTECASGKAHSKDVSE